MPHGGAYPAARFLKRRTAYTHSLPVLFKCPGFRVPRRLERVPGMPTMQSLSGDPALGWHYPSDHLLCELSLSRRATKSSACEDLREEDEEEENGIDHLPSGGTGGYHADSEGGDSSRKSSIEVERPSSWRVMRRRRLQAALLDNTGGPTPEKPGASQGSLTGTTTDPSAMPKGRTTTTKAYSGSSVDGGHAENPFQRLSVYTTVTVDAAGTCVVGTPPQNRSTSQAASPSMPDMPQIQPRHSWPGASKSASIQGVSKESSALGATTGCALASSKQNLSVSGASQGSLTRTTDPSAMPTGRTTTAKASSGSLADGGQAENPFQSLSIYNTATVDAAGTCVVGTPRQSRSATQAASPSMPDMPQIQQRSKHSWPSASKSAFSQGASKEMSVAGATTGCALAGSRQNLSVSGSPQSSSTKGPAATQSATTPLPGTPHEPSTQGASTGPSPTGSAGMWTSCAADEGPAQWASMRPASRTGAFSRISSLGANTRNPSRSAVAPASGVSQRSATVGATARFSSRFSRFVGQVQAMAPRFSTWQRRRQQNSLAAADTARHNASDTFSSVVIS